MFEVMVNIAIEELSSLGEQKLLAYLKVQKKSKSRRNPVCIPRMEAPGKQITVFFIFF